MGQIFTLDPSVIGIMDKAVQDMILYLGKDCKIVYPPIIIPCPNCIQDPIGSKSKNIYLPGGPIPFPLNSICPVCDGAGGTKAEDTFDIERFIVNWKPKDYMNVKVDNIRVAQGMIKVKGNIEHMPKIQMMSYFVPHIDIDAYGHYRFRLAAEPISAGNIVQGKYFTAILERIPG